MRVLSTASNGLVGRIMYGIIAKTRHPVLKTCGCDLYIPHKVVSRVNTLKRYRTRVPFYVRGLRDDIQGGTQPLNAAGRTRPLAGSLFMAPGKPGSPRPGRRRLTLWRAEPIIYHWIHGTVHAAAACKIAGFFQPGRKAAIPPRTLESPGAFVFINARQGGMPYHCDNRSEVLAGDQKVSRYCHSLCSAGCRMKRGPAL